MGISRRMGVAISGLVFAGGSALALAAAARLAATGQPPAKRERSASDSPQRAAWAALWRGRLGSQDRAAAGS